MKPKFKIHAAVTTPTGPGVITKHTAYADHLEHLVEFPDKTATWFHEDKLQPAASPNSDSASPRPKTPDPRPQTPDPKRDSDEPVRQTTGQDN